MFYLLRERLSSKETKKTNLHSKFVYQTDGLFLVDPTSLKLHDTVML